MTTALLRLEDLAKSFGALKVTDGISLDILAGETHAIIGPNGAGKTIADPPDLRRACPRRRPHHLRRPRRHASADAGARTARPCPLVPDHARAAALHGAGERGARRAGTLGRRASASGSRPPAKRRSTLRRSRRLRTVGLAARAQTPAGALSHGEKRRLELAIALAQAPKLLLLDEPMAGAGAEETRRLVATLEALKRRYTIVLVEHDMQAVFALADRISVLVEGQIIATGDAARPCAPTRPCAPPIWARRHERGPARHLGPAGRLRRVSRCCSASTSPSARARWSA